MNWKDHFHYDKGFIYRKKNGVISDTPVGATANPRYYYSFSIRICGKQISSRVHVVVWEMHRGKREKGLVVDHINENKLDNRVENLRLVTYKENSMFYYNKK